MKKLFGLTAPLVAVAAFATPALASVPVLTNGDFADPAVNGSYETISAGSTAITGWTVTSGSVDLIGSYWAPAISGTPSTAGAQSLDLAGNSTGGISTTVGNLTVGDKYNVLFYMAGNPDGGNVIKSLSTFISGPGNTGLTSGTYSFDTTGHTEQNMGWIRDQLTFTAVSSSETLSFLNYPYVGLAGASSPYGAALSNVSVAAVPEASTWAMMIIGFGLVGVSIRRRSRKSVDNGTGGTLAFA